MDLPHGKYEDLAKDLKLTIHLSTRNIQTQLSALLPNYATAWRQYRPNGIEKGKTRLSHLKSCRKEQIAKHARRCARSQKYRGIPRNISLESLGSSQPNQTQYADTLPGIVPSHISMPDLSAWYSTQSSEVSSLPSKFSNISSEGYSDKQVVLLEQEDDPTFLRSHCPALKSSVRCSMDSTEPNPDHRSLQGYSEAQKTEEFHMISILDTSQVQPSRLPLEVVKSSSRGSIRSIRSTKTMRSRITSKLSVPMSHINSVLSATASWRSSLVYAMSISTGRLSNGSCHSFSRDEFTSWNELVDESMLESRELQDSDLPAISLIDRPCCSFFEKDKEKRKRCDNCGFSDMHQLARYSMSDDLGMIDCLAVDRFGNLPLHHAAAVGNTIRVNQLIAAISQHPSTLNVNHRNTSGETFLHVFRLADSQDFPDFMEVLSNALNNGFRFSAVDYSGRLIGQWLFECANFRAVEPSQLRQAEEFLYLQGAIVQLRVLELPGSFALGTEPFDKPITNARDHGASGPALNMLRDILKFPRSKIKDSSQNGTCFEDLTHNGDTKLMVVLREWSQHPKSNIELERLIQDSNVHMRDERGYTALAIAAREGISVAVSLLLQHGANPNTRSHDKTSVIAHAADQLRNKENDKLYAEIVCCMALLSDKGAKYVATVYDEFSLLTPPAITGQETRIKTVRSKLRKGLRLKSLEAIPEMPLEIHDRRKEWRQQYDKSSMIAQDGSIHLSTSMPWSPIDAEGINSEEWDNETTAGLKSPRKRSSHERHSPPDIDAMSIDPLMTTREVQPESNTRWCTSDPMYELPTDIDYGTHQSNSAMWGNNLSTSTSTSTSHTSLSYNDRWNLPTVYLGTETGPNLFNMSQMTTKEQRAEGLKVPLQSYEQFKGLTCRHPQNEGNLVNPLGTQCDAAMEAPPLTTAMIPVSEIIGDPVEMYANFKPEFAPSKALGVVSTKAKSEVSNETVLRPLQHGFNEAMGIALETYAETPVQRLSQPKTIDLERQEERKDEECRRQRISASVKASNLTPSSLKRHRIDSPDDRTETLYVSDQPALTCTEDLEIYQLGGLSPAYDCNQLARQGRWDSQPGQLRPIKRKKLLDSYRMSITNRRLSVELGTLGQKQHLSRPKTYLGGPLHQNTPTDCLGSCQVISRNLTDIDGTGVQDLVARSCSINAFQGCCDPLRSTPSDVTSIASIQNGSKLIGCSKEGRIGQNLYDSGSLVSKDWCSMPNAIIREQPPHSMPGIVSEPAEHLCDLMPNLESGYIAANQSLEFPKPCFADFRSRNYDPEDDLSWSGLALEESHPKLFTGFGDSAGEQVVLSECEQPPG